MIFILIFRAVVPQLQLNAIVKLIGSYSLRLKLKCFNLFNII